MIALLVVLGVLVLLILWFVGMYNSLVQGRVQMQNAWSQIDVQLKRRHDLIPNLVETAKGYVKHERGTLEAIVQARSAAMQAAGPAAAAKAEGALTDALSKFFLVVENYPDLKANQNFLALQEELSSTENKVGFARQFYNDQVQSYNVKTQSVPTNIVASIFNFKAAEFFRIEAAAEREAPKVSF
jgi:LemA protein